MIHWMDLVLAFALVARLLLSLASVVHAKAAVLARVSSIQLAGNAESRAQLRAQPLFWVAATLALVSEVVLGIAVLLGGAIVLPLLAPTAALLDNVARWQFLRDPPPQLRTLVGGVLAMAAAATAARLAPDARSLPLETLWLSLQTLPAQLLLGSLVSVLLIAEAVTPLKLLTVQSEVAILHGAQAGLYGIFGASLAATLASCLRSEWTHRRQFESPCAMELALATLVAATFQGRRLHRAYQLAVDKSMIARVHGAVLIGGAPAMIAVIFAPLTEGDLGLVAPSKWSPPPPVLFGGFGSRWAELGFATAVLCSIGGLLLVYRPRGGDLPTAGGGLFGGILGAPRLAGQQWADLEHTLLVEGQTAPPSGRDNDSSSPMAPSRILTARTAASLRWGSEAEEPRGGGFGSRSPLRKPAQARKPLLAPAEWKRSLAYALPPSPRVPSFRPSAPLRRFDAALDAKYQRHRRSATAAREVGSPEPRSPPRSPGGWAAPEFIQGHPAAFDAESLWRFTSRLRAHGESLDGWAAAVVEAADALDEAASLEAVMPSSPSPRVELASPRDEDVAGLLHWILLVLLALLTTIPAFVVWEESGRTLPHDEVILIGMVCLQIAFIVHGATLRTCMRLAHVSDADEMPPLQVPPGNTRGRDVPGNEGAPLLDTGPEPSKGTRHRRAPAGPTAATPPSTALLRKFPMRQDDLELEAQLKGSPEMLHRKQQQRRYTADDEYTA